MHWASTVALSLLLLILQRSTEVFCFPKQPSNRRRFQSERSHYFAWHPVSSAIRSSSSLQWRQQAADEEKETDGNRAGDLTTNNGARRKEDKASMPNLITSLVKSVVGSGIFALPAGIAAMSTASGASGIDVSGINVVVAALVIIGLVGAMNAYFFSLLGSCCELTDTTSFGEAWDAANQQKKPGTLVPLVLVLKTLLSCLAFSIILADSYQSLAIGLLGWDVTRTQALLSVTLTTVAPLCLLRDLKALAPFSALGIAGISFTVFGMVYRLLDGSYGTPTTAISMGGGAINWSGALVLACTLATAFVAHYNAPRFYAELENPTPARWSTVVYSSFAIAGLIFGLVGTVGYQTFGSATQGFILNHYGQDDGLMTLARLALAISITFSYPLPFVGMRDSVLQLLPQQTSHDEDSDQPRFLAVTFGLLAVVTAVAIQVEDLALIATIGGGTFSTIVASVLPALMYRGAVGMKDKPSESSLQVNLTMALMAISVAIGGAGVTLSLTK